MKKYKPKLSTPIGRWAAIGPYYAMFPLEFAFKIIEKYSKPGELVVDPFAGRASSIYAAATQGRHGLGVEINPLGWVYAQTKLNPAPLKSVEGRLRSILKSSKSAIYKKQAEKLPEFYRWCFSKEVLTFLLAARKNLDWQRNRVDRTLMSFILIYLHGKLGQSLSNQTRQAKAMSQNYSVTWWKKRNLKAPKVDIKEFMLQRIRWRYAKGVPQISSSAVKIGDSTKVLKGAVRSFTEKTGKKCSLFFTSPPYYGLTHYHKDQWLRLWVLGGVEKPAWSSDKHKGRFDSKVEYKELLDNIFSNAAKMMDQSAVVYVRTDSREFTKNTTLEILRKHFPDWEEKIVVAPVVTKTQTTTLGNRSSKTGEIDIILTRS